MLLLANIILARTLSVEDFGQFSFAISLGTILSLPVAGGLPMLLTREIAQNIREDKWVEYRGLVTAAYHWVLGSSSLICLGLSLWSFAMANTHGPEMLAAFLLIPLLGLAAITNGMLKGLGLPVLAEAPNQIMQPSVMIGGYSALAWLWMASSGSILFGISYDELSYLPMIIFSMMQILSISIGRTGIFLTMSGRENLSLLSRVVALNVTALACLHRSSPMERLVLRLRSAPGLLCRAI